MMTLNEVMERSYAQWEKCQTCPHSRMHGCASRRRGPIFIDATLAVFGIQPAAVTPGRLVDVALSTCAGYERKGDL